ncbi:DUF2510 domain-containing protein [Rhodococcoides fascians]|uniref:DUF2510 domain-containing protein n=1 Tax=Rhodococcoides fascians TaxID=1828 RepID=UPI00068C9D4A|nr:DUF2510 domain-containing protein [Rhodococcus fascians]
MTHPAGWYPDPSSPQQQRYWDGQTWSQHVQPAGPTPPPSQPAKKRRDPLRTVLTIAGVILVAGFLISLLTDDTESARNTNATTAPAVTAPVDPELMNTASYAELTDRDFQLLIKDPDAAAGQKHVIYGEVTQLDAATGTRNMRIDAMATPPTDRFVLGDNAVVSVSDPELLRPIVSGDRVKIYATVKGALSYDTQIGGSTTVPEFSAAMIDVIPQ